MCIIVITAPVLQNSKRVKRRKDQLRVQITRVLELAAEHSCFKDNPVCINENGSLGMVFVDFVESVRWVWPLVISVYRMMCVVLEHSWRVRVTEILLLHSKSYGCTSVASLPTS